VIQLLFFLRFRTQLRQARPETLSALETALFKAFEDAGAIAINKERVIAAAFDESSLGVWLNVVTVLETALELIEKARDFPSGSFMLVIGKDVFASGKESLCRDLASVHGGSGLWCASTLQGALRSYCSFEDKTAASGVYIQIKHIETISRSIKRPAAAFPLSEKIVQMLKQKAGQNVALSGPRFIGKREGLYRFCTLLGNLPPLTLRFRNLENTAQIGAFADLLNPKIHALFNTGIARKQLEKIDALRATVFRERLRSEYSAALVQNSRRFFQVVLETYCDEMRLRNATPVLVLENIQNVDDTALRIFMDVWNALPSSSALRVYGTYAAENDDALKNWSAVFHHVIILPPEPVPLLFASPADIAPDLWELAYTFSLLVRYFPGTMVPRLFEETGRNHTMLLRVFAMLTRFGIIDSIDDPVPHIRGFTAIAEKMIGERKALVHTVVRERLLASVACGNLSACFNLLEYVRDLGGEISDELAWIAIRADVLDDTTGRINKAIAEKRFGALVGEHRNAALRSMFATLDALVRGNEKALRVAFVTGAPPGVSPEPVLYQTQHLMNRACYQLGVKSGAEALDTVRKIIRLNQEQEHSCPAQAYRLLAIINLLRQKIVDAGDYAAIAVDYAEKQGASHELGIATYYEANIQYLTGNLSKAERLAAAAERNAAAAGRYDWADRCRFLRGRLRFEFGFYQDALHLFEKTLENLTAPVSETMKSALSAWIFRTKAFSPGHTAVSGSATPDALLFEAEAAYFRGDYKKALTLTETIQGAPPTDGFLYTDRPDWRSGFAQCELLLIPERDFWTRIASAYHSLALSRLSPTAATRQQAVSELSWVSSNELAPDTDPNDAFYFYALYRVLRESGAERLDTNTVIGMAFKRLQQRSIKIDEPEARRTFLNRPYWNNILTLAAKEHKLV
jgi:tetratricopeptide (TPR) repeat protein